MRLVAMIAVSLCWAGCFAGDCYENRVMGFEVALPADEAMQFRLDRCAVDPETCVEVCTLAMERAYLSAHLDRCQVTTEPERVIALASWEVYTGSCGQGDDSLNEPAPEF
jgi:hypothetical protein